MAGFTRPISQSYNLLATAAAESSRSVGYGNRDILKNVSMSLPKSVQTAPLYKGKRNIDSPTVKTKAKVLRLGFLCSIARFRNTLWHAVVSHLLTRDKNRDTPTPLQFSLFGQSLSVSHKQRVGVKSPVWFMQT